MPLTHGSRLGPYEILAPIGAGGMGEVYKARDTRLGRDVAIKVLPSRLASSDEARQRFEREAKTIFTLSHPHICALCDMGNQEDVEYLVMEYLEGETLADRLAKKPLPFEDVLRYGVQIADALDRAHRQGIVHRDLKPANVMLTKSGVKLLDNLMGARFSPDGRWLDYESEESGVREVFVQSFPGPGERRQISTGGGGQPRWRGDGKKLFYVSPDRKIMAATIRTRPSLGSDPPHAWFQTRILPTVEARNHYDVTADGQRFLVNSRRPEDAALPMTVVVGGLFEPKK